MDAETAKALPRCEAVKAARQFFMAPALTVIDSIRGDHLGVERWAEAGRAVTAMDADARTTKTRCFGRCDVMPNPFRCCPLLKSGEPVPAHYSRVRAEIIQV